MVKTLTWLRMIGAPYDYRVLRRPPRSRTGKVPYLQLGDGRYVEGSDQILRHVADRVGVSLDAGLSPEQLAHAHAMRRLLEENLYFVITWSRWLTAEGFRALQPVYFGEVPRPFRGLLALFLRRQMRRNLHGQGMGRLPESEIRARAEEDVTALATLLGERDYFFGEPSAIDATAYAMLAAGASAPYPCLVGEAVRRTENLPRFLERMRARYWADLPG